MGASLPKIMNTDDYRKKFGIIGCGRTGIYLGAFLSGQFFLPVAFYSRSIESAVKASREIRGGKVYETPEDAARVSDIVFIATPDNVIESVCERIAENKGFDENSVVFHLSGALSSDILESAKDSGASRGSIHPLQAFPPYRKGQKSPFKDINISIEGDKRAVELGKKIVTTLKARSFTIPTDAKTIYHASAVVASNYLVTVENFALELLIKTGLSEKKAYEILEPLIQGTLTNIKTRGSVNALTGPVARGDDRIVSKHLEDMDRKIPEFSPLYRLLGKYTLDIASRRGELSSESLEKLSRLFRS